MAKLQQFEIFTYLRLMLNLLGVTGVREQTVAQTTEFSLLLFPQTLTLIYDMPCVTIYGPGALHSQTIRHFDWPFFILSST